MQVKLAKNINDQFPMGQIVEIYKVNLRTPRCYILIYKYEHAVLLSIQGSTDPLTAENALYSVKCTITTQKMSQTGNPIRTSPIPHELLWLTPDGTSAHPVMHAVILFHVLSLIFSVDNLS